MPGTQDLSEALPYPLGLRARLPTRAVSYLARTCAERAAIEKTGKKHRDKVAFRIKHLRSKTRCNGSARERFEMRQAGETVVATLATGKWFHGSNRAEH